MSDKLAPHGYEGIPDPKILVTWENLTSLKYTPQAGVRYEVAPGCVRVIKRPVYDLQMSYDKEMSKEDSKQINPEVG